MRLLTEGAHRFPVQNPKVRLVDGKGFVQPTPQEFGKDFQQLGAGTIYNHVLSEHNAEWKDIQKDLSTDLN